MDHVKMFDCFGIVKMSRKCEEEVAKLKVSVPDSPTDDAEVSEAADGSLVVRTALEGKEERFWHVLVELCNAGYLVFYDLFDQSESLGTSVAGYMVKIRHIPHPSDIRRQDDSVWTLSRWKPVKAVKGYGFDEMPDYLRRITIDVVRTHSFFRFTGVTAQGVIEP